MSGKEIHAITGAFGYSGRYIAHRLLDRGEKVMTLTNSLHRANEFGGRIEAYPFKWDQPGELAKSLQGVRVLYNTYWVRFNHKLFTHSMAVENTLKLFDAAKEAGVERIVHVSITNPSESSPLEYFKGKGQLERALQELGVSYAILRPAVLFGKEDILINNIAWALRNLPVFGVFGEGNYGIQPIYVEDLADLAVEQAEGRENVTIDAIGPESFTYRELVENIGWFIGCSRPVIGVPPWFGYWAGKVIGWFVGDVMITREEVQGLMAGLLHVDSPPTGKTKLTQWVKEHRETLGRRYTSELARRKDRAAKYASN